MKFIHVVYIHSYVFVIKYFIRLSPYGTLCLRHWYVHIVYMYIYMCMCNTIINKNTWGVKKCGANQKQYCKQAGATKRFDISRGQEVTLVTLLE